MRFGNVLRVLIFFLIGGVILIAQADRSSRSNPALALMLPAGLGGFADFERARLFLADDPARAVRSARDVLLHRPVPARHLSVYAAANVRAERPEEAAAALTLAAARGWRDQYTQVNALVAFVDQNDFGGAMQRFKALVQARRPDIISAAAGEYLLQNTSAVPAMASSLSEDPEFARRVINLARTSPAFGRALGSAIAAAESGPKKLECSTLGNFVQIMLLENEPGVAADAWPDRCDVSDPQNLAFSSSEDSQPFRWAYPNDGAISVTPNSEAGTISVRNRSPARKQIAYRYLQLSPGPVTFAASHEREGSVSGVGGVADLELRMRCGGRGSDETIRITQAGPDAFSASIPENCPIQFLGVFAGRGQLTGLRLSIR